MDGVTKQSSGRSAFIAIHSTGLGVTHIRTAERQS
jgi:hypothetical protein